MRSSVWKTILPFLAAAACCGAMEVRTYVASRHDRFSGFPEAPVWNDSAYYGSRNFTGVGWVLGESPARQLALVTPRHVLFANHYRPADGTVIRFLNASGATVDRTVAGAVIVPSAAGAATDLLLVTLSAPLLAGDGVTPFPYLNLANDNAYRNTVLTIFGWHAKAGRGTIASIQDLTPSGIGMTRTIRFNYSKLTGNADEVRLVVGDSGSPSFAMAGTTPALVGVHLAAGEMPAQYVNYDSFVPFYVPQLNTLLASAGYQMAPAYPATVMMEVAAVTTPAILRQAKPGSCRFDLQNSSAAAAGNVKFELHFPTGGGPDSVTASGWIVDRAGPDVWEMHRADLAGGATVPVTASWAKLPLQSQLPVDVIRAADGSPQQTQTFELELAPSYAAWADGLSGAGTADDPDADGISNLLEYAFGGDPEIASVSSATGGILTPRFSQSGSELTLQFPVRTDALERGLTYVLEFSASLAAGSWTTGPPAGFSSADAAMSPAVGGFVLRTVHFNADVPRRFCRVKVGLVEPAE